ncbi:MAG: tetratricopeptide repeat protein [Terriglobia bacterium]
MRIVFERAQKALGSGDYASARQGFLKVLKSDPNSAAAYTDLGVTYQRMGDLDEAIIALEKAKSLAPAAPGIDLNLGLVYYRKHQFKRAIPHLANVVKAYPDNVQARYLEGLSQFMLNEYGPTVQSLDPIWSEEKNDLDYLFVLGICYGKLKRDTESARVFSRLVQQGGDTPHLHLLLGKAYLDLYQDQKARSELEKAVAGDGKLPFAHYNLGVAYERLGKLKEAGEEFDQEMALHPSQPWAYQERGRLWVRLGSGDKAVPLFQEALRIDSKLPLSLAGLGGAYLLEGKTNQAIHDLRQALILEPDSADFHYQLGRAYLKAKQKARAQEQFAQAEKLQAKAREEQAEELTGHLPPPGSQQNQTRTR